MSAVLRALFDGKHLLPERSHSLAAGQTYLLRVDEVDSTTTPAKVAAVSLAMRNQAFLDDLRDMAEDFAALDAVD